MKLLARFRLALLVFIVCVGAWQRPVLADDEMLPLCDWGAECSLGGALDCLVFGATVCGSGSFCMTYQGTGTAGCCYCSVICNCS